MSEHDVELLAVGAGPSNLALAVALEELAPDLARSSMIVEREQDICWQRGMLFPESLSNTSFLKDLVTLRDPTSKFSFLNYLHVNGRLDHFINMASFVPYRTEVAGYLSWVARSLGLVDLRLGRECAEIAPLWTEDRLTGWSARMADGETITSRYLVVGAGRDVRVPEALRGIAPERVIHSTQYLRRLAQLRRDLPYRVVVVGGGQSAAELVYSVRSELPECRPTLVMRSIGFQTYETSKFTNELYFPTFVDEFHAARPEARAQMLSEMHHTNYAGVEPGMMDSLYRRVYLDRLHGRPPLTVLTMRDITGARDEGDEVVLELSDRRDGTVEELRADVVLLGTGFTPVMPAMVRTLAGALGLMEIAVNRNYRLVLDQPASAACYLHGVNESTHGIGDSLLALLATRATDILQDILTQRAVRPDVPVTAAAPGRVAAAG